MATVADILDALTREGELYEALPNNEVRCYACGHRCLIRDGRRGVCKVRFNRDGKAVRAVGLRGRPAGRPDREKTVLPHAARQPGADLWHAGL